MKRIQCAHPPHHHNGFMHVEHSVCHEPISVLINVFMLLAWSLLSTLLALTLTMHEYIYIYMYKHGVFCLSQHCHNT